MRVKIIVLYLLVFFFIVSSIAFGSIQIEEVVVNLIGRTPNEAVVNCLVEAIRQKRGVEIDALSETRFSLEDLFHRQGIEEFHREVINDEVLEEIRMHTNGLIEKYEVLSLNQMNDGSWEARVRSFVPVYRHKVDSSKRSTLAIMPIMPHQGLKPAEGIDINEIARQISQRLTTQFVQTRHYNILDREYGNEFEKERQLIISGGFPIKEMARLEEQLGADYLLIGTLSDVHSSITTQEWYGKDVTRCQVLLSIDVRAVEFATRQVHRAEIVTVSLDRIIGIGGINNRTKQIPGNIVSELVNELITKLNRGFLDILMPVRVLDIQNGTIYLNQGGARIQEGEIFSILGPHRTVTDPGSGALIRIEGDKLAEIVVNNVMEEYSIAELVYGEENELKTGLRCNRIK
jgi:curli biogenesis system outer membrane secretion channel CsgG